MLKKFAGREASAVRATPGGPLRTHVLVDGGNQTQDTGAVNARPEAAVPPNLADLPKQTFRIMVSAGLDNLDGHSSTRPLRRHEPADP